MRGLLAGAVLLAACLLFAPGSQARTDTDPSRIPNIRQLCEQQAKPADGAQLGTLRIPGIGLETSWYQGLWSKQDCLAMYYASQNSFLPELDHGPAHYPANAMPWQPGTVVLSGHRVTHTHPFLNLGNVRLGFLVELQTARGIFRYRVAPPPNSPSFLHGNWDTSGAPCVIFQACGVLSGNEGWELLWNFRSGHWLELLACTPPHTSTDRLVVFAKLVGS